MARQAYRMDQLNDSKLEKIEYWRRRKGFKGFRNGEKTRLNVQFWQLRRPKSLSWMFEKINSFKNSPNGMRITSKASIFEHDIAIDFEKGILKARLFYKWRARHDWRSDSKTQRRAQKGRKDKLKALFSG